MMLARLSLSATLLMLAFAGCQKNPPAASPPPSAEGSLGNVRPATAATTGCSPVTALDSLCTKFNESRCRFEVCSDGPVNLRVIFGGSISLTNLLTAELVNVSSECMNGISDTTPGVPFWEYIRGRWRSKQSRRTITTTLPMSGVKAVEDPALINIVYENPDGSVLEYIVPLPDGMPPKGGLQYCIKPADTSGRQILIDVRNGDGSTPILARDLFAVAFESSGRFEQVAVKDIVGLADKIECMRYEANVTRGLNKAFTRNCTTSSSSSTPPSSPQASQSDARFDLVPAAVAPAVAASESDALETGSSSRIAPARRESAVARRSNAFDGRFASSAAGAMLLAAPPSPVPGDRPGAKAPAATGKESDGTESGLPPSQERLAEGPAFDKNNCTLPAGKPPDIKATYQDAVAPSKLHMATMRADTSKNVAGSNSTTPPAPFWEYIHGRWRSHNRGRTKTLPMSGATTDLVIMTFTQHVSSTSDAQWVVLLADGIDNAREEKVSVTVMGANGQSTVIELKAKGGTLVKDLEVVESLDAGRPAVKKKVSEVPGLEPIINEGRDAARKKNFDKAFARSCPDQPVPPRPSGQ